MTEKLIFENWGSNSKISSNSAGIMLNTTGIWDRFGAYVRNNMLKYLRIIIKTDTSKNLLILLLYICSMRGQWLAVNITIRHSGLFHQGTWRDACSCI